MKTPDNHLVRVESHQIRRGHPLYEALDELTFKSKNLYNSALYALRQIYFENEKRFKAGKKPKKLPTYSDFVKVAKNSDDFKALPAKVSQQSTKMAFDDFTYFFKALKAYSANPKKFKARPKPPGYKHPQLGRQLIRFSNQAVSSKWKSNGLIKLSGEDWTIPFRAFKTCSKLSEVTISPRLDYYQINVVYRYQTDVVAKGCRVCAIDPGLNNLASVAFTRRNSLLVPGRPVKAMNAYYNGLIAAAKSELPSGIFTSHKIRSLLRRRHNKIKDYMHKATTKLIDTLYDSKVRTIVIGHNKDQKQGIRMKNFVQVPRTMFNTMLEYKAIDRGMRVIFTEESYTSKASSMDCDKLPAKLGGKHKFSGKRIKRGLYRTKNKTLVNADVNGAYNILRKVYPKVIRKVPRWSDRIRGFLVTPESLPVSFGW